MRSLAPTTSACPRPPAISARPEPQAPRLHPQLAALLGSWASPECHTPELLTAPAPCSHPFTRPTLSLPSPRGLCGGLDCRTGPLPPPGVRPPRQADRVPGSARRLRLAPGLPRPLVPGGCLCRPRLAALEPT